MAPREFAILSRRGAFALDVRRRRGDTLRLMQLFVELPLDLVLELFAAVPATTVVFVLHAISLR
jgi:hypothetical protein